MREEAAVREVQRWRKGRVLISDDAASMLAALWASGGSDAQRHLYALADTGEVLPGLAAAVRTLREEKASDDMDKDVRADLVAELEALIAWAEAKESAAA